MTSGARKSARASRIRIRKGLDIPIAGLPQQRIEAAPPVTTVALLGPDTIGLEPRLAVGVGDRVRTGQTLLVDKRDPDVRYTAPGAGEVIAINRGPRRALQSVVIRLGEEGHEAFDASPAARLGELGGAAVRAMLLASGLWPSFRTRPYSRVPPAAGLPAALFVTAIDTQPLAADPAVVIQASGDAFAAGLDVIAQLLDGPVHVCTAPGAAIPVPEREPFWRAEFAGPHPAGLPGTHIHFLLPASENRTVWHIGYQDVIAIGRLFLDGRWPVRRIVALGGPRVASPRLLDTRFGASIDELVAGQLQPGRCRVISGSVLSGRRAAGPLNWLGRYDTQVSVLAEGREREFLPWLRPGPGRYSASRTFVSHFLRRRYPLDTAQFGRERALVPIGAFERVMPLDILPTPLLKALLVGDTERARALGCLELDEEDLALCSFVCNGKYEYGPYLREALDLIARGA